MFILQIEGKFDPEFIRRVPGPKDQENKKLPAKLGRFMLTTYKLPGWPAAIASERRQVEAQYPCEDT